jgi:hypothetical protein
MDSKAQFITEYFELCRKHKAVIEPLGWCNLIISTFNSKEEFEKTLQEHIKHYERYMNDSIG